MEDSRAFKGDMLKAKSLLHDNAIPTVGEVAFAKKLSYGAYETA